MKGNSARSAFRQIFFLSLGNPYYDRAEQAERVEILGLKILDGYNEHISLEMKL